MADKNTPSRPKVTLTKKTFDSMTKVERTMKNKPVFIGLIVLSALAFGVMVGFNALAGNPKLSKYSPFHTTIGNISAHHPLNITPAGWAFSIWGLIYLFQFGSVAYSVLLLCRHTNGLPAYSHPAVLSPLYFVLITFSCVLNVGWLFQWDYLMFNAALVFLACQSLVLFTALMLVSTRLVFYSNDLIDSGRKLDISILRVIVVNGLGMYATWSTIATIINLGVAATYRWKIQHLDQDTVSVICVFVLMAFQSTYFALDTSVFDRYTTHTFTPYLTIIWATAAIIAKNWDASRWSSVATACTLGMAVLILVVKVVLCFRRRGVSVNLYRRLQSGGLLGAQPLKLNLSDTDK